MANSEALNQFALWIPGELEYSARKACYDKKVARAQLPIDDPRSVHSFLGSEWHHFQMAHRQGVDYYNFHGKSAQLQLAKFAAGLFDKAALSVWIYERKVGDVKNRRCVKIHSAFGVSHPEVKVLEIGEDVGVRHHDALGTAGCAARIDQS